MIRIRHVVVTALLAALVGATATQAQTRALALTPGLWELDSQMQSGSPAVDKAMAQAQQQMAALPADQRTMLQAMLDKQGIRIGAGGPGAMVIQVCLTQEMLARDAIVTQQGECRTQHAPRVGNTMQIQFKCAKPPSSGQGEVSFLGPRQYRSRMTVNTTASGTAEQFVVTSNGKWVSADCGNVVPVGAGSR